MERSAEQVESTLRDTVAIAREMFGHGHQHHVRAVENLESYLRGIGRTEEAEAISRIQESQSPGTAVGRRRARRRLVPDNALGTPLPAVLDIRTAARYLAISRETLYKLVRSGEIPHVRIGKSIRFRSSEIDRFLDERSTRDWTRVDGRGRPRLRR